LQIHPVKEAQQRHKAQGDPTTYVIVHEAQEGRFPVQFAHYFGVHAAILSGSTS
jgi:hypothetical protein